MAKVARLEMTPCTAKKLNDCKKKAFKKEWIEETVITKTRAILMDDAAIGDIVSTLTRMRDEESFDLPIYKNQLWETETAIDNIVNAVFVYDDKLLTFNFKDGTRTVTLSDVQTATDKSGSDLEMFGASNKKGFQWESFLLPQGTRIIKYNSPPDCCSIRA